MDHRRVVCTIHSSATETRWGKTQFRFPARSYLIYTAPSGKCVTGFRFHPSETFIRNYCVYWDTVSRYLVHPLPLPDRFTTRPGPGEDTWQVAGDRLGDDNDMMWVYAGRIQVATADIDYSNLYNKRSDVAPSDFGKNFGRGPFGF